MAATTATLRSIIVVGQPAPFSASNALNATTSLRSVGRWRNRKNRRQKKEGPQEPISAEFGFGVSSFVRTDGGVCRRKQGCRPNKVPLYSSSKRPRPSVVAQDRISARETANAFTFCRRSPSATPPLRLASICGICCYTTPCASSAISQYLFYTRTYFRTCAYDGAKRI